MALKGCYTLEIKICSKVLQLNAAKKRSCFSFGIKLAMFTVLL